MERKKNKKTPKYFTILNSQDRKNPPKQRIQSQLRDEDDGRERRVRKRKKGGINRKRKKTQKTKRTRREEEKWKLIDKKYELKTKYFAKTNTVPALPQFI
uniref:Uncharacterized protein n=1 Tax=Cacopsylla melanoneura TaxID=428564 RepID=A0A8D8TXM5_9HEMI